MPGRGSVQAVVIADEADEAGRCCSKAAKFSISGVLGSGSISRASGPYADDKTKKGEFGANTTTSWALGVVGKRMKINIIIHD
jgi:hypothetical protein